MELLYASLLASFLVPIIYLSQQYFLSYKNHKSGGNANLPPGKTGFPVIGESFELISAGWKGHPEKFILDRIAKYSSHVFRTSLAGSPAVVFCGPNGHKFLFSNENNLVDVWFPPTLDKLFPYIMKTSSKEEGLKFKQMLPNFFKPAALQGYVGIMDNIAHRHFVIDWERRDTVVVSPLSKSYTFWLAFRLFVSVEDPNCFARLKKPFGLLSAGIQSIPINLPGTTFNRAIKASNFIRKELLLIIKQRKIDLAEGKASPAQDILSHMLLLSDDNGKFMHEEDVADKILGVLVGGYDTVSSVSTSIVKYLAELPEVYQRVYREQLEIAKSKAPGDLLNWNDIQKMKYSWNVAREVMRLAPPIQGSFREALTDFTYNGFSIPKGSKIYWSVHSTHKNSEFFSEPQKFDPSRFEGSRLAPYTYLPFGGGPRMCPGNGYARLVILVFMHHLVKRFRWEKLIPDEKLIYDPIPEPEKGLPIRLFPHEA